MGDKNKKLTEYALHQLILENMDDFLKELGIGFTYVGSEVKIKIGDRYNYIDFLLFNVKYNILFREFISKLCVLNIYFATQLQAIR